MVHAGCVFDAGIHLSRTWTSGSFESVWWNACVHRLDLSLYSHSTVLGGMEFEPMLTPREKSPLPENFPRGGSNPRRCGQRAQTLPTSYSGPHSEPFKLGLQSRKMNSTQKHSCFQRKTSGPHCIGFQPFNWKKNVKKKKKNFHWLLVQHGK